MWGRKRTEKLNTFVSKFLIMMTLLCYQRKTVRTREIIYSSPPRGSAKESFVGNETAHNQGLLAASTDIISPLFLHSHMAIIYFLPQSLLDDQMISSPSNTATFLSGN